MNSHNILRNCWSRTHHPFPQGPPLPILVIGRLVGALMEPGGWLCPRTSSIYHVPLPGQARTPASITSLCTGAWQPSGSSWAWRGWHWSSHWAPCFCTGAPSSGCSAEASRKGEPPRLTGSLDLRRFPSLHEAPQWPQKPPPPASRHPTCPLLATPPPLPTHSLPSQSWSRGLSGQRKETGASKKVAERRGRDRMGDRCVWRRTCTGVPEPLPPK